MSRKAFLAATLGLTLCTSALPQTPSEQLTIYGAVTTPMKLTVAQLQAMPATEMRSVTVPRRVAGRDSSSVLRGVPLTTLLDKAGLNAPGRNDWKHTVVVAAATDDYRVAFSWAELFNSDSGAGVLVILERDGAPLAPSEGAIALISSRDTRTGPRSVKWLKSIEVRVLDQ